jgi:hypothetical protein
VRDLRAPDHNKVIKSIRLDPSNSESIVAVKAEAQIMAIMQRHGEKDRFPVFLAGFTSHADVLYV